MSERVIEFEVAGVPHIWQEGALAALLDADVVYVSGSDKECKLFIGHSDLFYWACSDGDPLLSDEIGALYLAWKADPKWGTTKYIAIKKRNMRPQWPVAKEMIADGAWNDSMKALPSRIDGGDHGWKHAPLEYQ